jgi:hypothetical protein
MRNQITAQVSCDLYLIDPCVSNGLAVILMRLWYPLAWCIPSC